MLNKLDSLVGGKISNGTEHASISLLSKRQPVDIEFLNLSYVVPTGRKNEPKTILNSVSGKFRTGRLTAIMGPSGAGKTTLMNVVAGYKTSNVSGTIRVNGQPRIIRQFRRSSCYIMQEDHHLPHLTVSEAMHVSAWLRLGPNTSDQEKENLISEILHQLSLDTARETRTSDLSGGQRKRLSIAVELINNPPVMFFDEPTSGLDSQNSLQCINLLRSLSEGGRTIICTIHQPSATIFETFHYLYALAGGQCIYRGTIPGILPYLSQIDRQCPPYHNPADFLIEVATSGEDSHKLVQSVKNGKCNNLVLKDDKPDNLCQKATRSESSSLLPLKPMENNNPPDTQPCDSTCLTMEPHHINGNQVLNHTSPDLDEDCEEVESYPTSNWKQFTVLSKRNYVSIMRDSLLTKMRFGSHIIVGVLFGILYYGIGNEASKFYSNCGLLFCCIFFAVFAGMLPTVLTFPLEMKVFLREHHNCWYSLKAYYIAKTMGDIPFQILYPIVFTSLVFFMTGQPFEFSRYAMFTIMVIMSSLVSQSLAVMIGAAMEVQEATFMAPIVVIPIMMFSGFFVTVSTIPYYIRWLTYTSFMRYAFEGILQATYGFERENLECSRAYCHHKLPVKIMEELGFEHGVYWQDLLALVCITVIFRIAGYFILRWRVRSQR